MRRFFLKFVRRVLHEAYSAYGFVVLGTRVSAHGLFTVQVPENVSVGRDCSINAGVLIVGRRSVVIGARVTLSARCMLLDTGLQVGDPERRHAESEIVIEDDVWVGAGAIVLAGVRIGRGSVIGAGSVVSRSIPANCVAVGNPARPIRFLSPAAGGAVADGVDADRSIL